ncbi:hypothetical protein QQ045_025639 [Rhodiola kirilowii]
MFGINWRKFSLYRKRKRRIFKLGQEDRHSNADLNCYRNASHVHMNPPTVHGCITSESVLLSENHEAKLGGFGGAKYCKIGGSTSEKEFEMGKDQCSRKRPPRPSKRSFSLIRSDLFN